MRIYYFIPLLNGHGELGYIGSVSAYKIIMLSKRDGDGIVYHCKLNEFHGQLLGTHWS